MAISLSHSRSYYTYTFWAMLEIFQLINRSLLTSFKLGLFSLDVPTLSITNSHYCVILFRETKIKALDQIAIKLLTRVRLYIGITAAKQLAHQCDAVQRVIRDNELSQKKNKKKRILTPGGKKSRKINPLSSALKTNQSAYVKRERDNIYICHVYITWCHRQYYGMKVPIFAGIYILTPDAAAVIR